MCKDPQTDGLLPIFPDSAIAEQEVISVYANINHNYLFTLKLISGYSTLVFAQQSSLLTPQHIMCSLLNTTFLIFTQQYISAFVSRICTLVDIFAHIVSNT